MSCCCSSTFDLCQVPACDQQGIKLTGLMAEQEGLYTLQVSFLDTDYNILRTFEIGQEITFSTVMLNEYMEYRAKLYAPDGSLVMYEESDCIQFTVRPVFALNEVETGSV